MKRTLVWVLLATIILSACAPGSAPTATPTASAALLPTDTPALSATPPPTPSPATTFTATPVPTATPTATPTHTPAPTATPTTPPTATPTPIPTLPPEQVGGLTGVPDPRYSNPKLFELSSPDAPIPQFVNALNKAEIEITAEQVVQGLTYQTLEVPKRDPQTGEILKDDRGNEIKETVVFGVYNLKPENLSYQYLAGTYHLFIFDTDKWRRLYPGEWWKLKDKFVGVYMGGELTKNYTYQRLATEHFGNGGILALSGQVRPGPDIEERKPDNSASKRSFDIANSYRMSLLFHYVAEPGKYPNNITPENVDQWLSERLQTTAQLMKQRPNMGPILVEYNEPFLVGRKNYRNPEREPLRDKHGETDYLGYFIYQVYKIFVDTGLEPGKDFIIIINEATPAHDPNSIFYIEQTLITQRENAFKQLVTEGYKVENPEEIPLILGLQTNNKNLPPKELGQLLTNIQKLDILLTEVYFYPERGNPVSNLAGYVKILNNNPRVKGLVLSSPFETDTIGPMTGIFDGDSPNINYYQLLR